jgi:hypothetical protein
MQEIRTAHVKRASTWALDYIIYEVTPCRNIISASMLVGRRLFYPSWVDEGKSKLRVGGDAKAEQGPGIHVPTWDLQV